MININKQLEEFITNNKLRIDDYEKEEFFKFVEVKKTKNVFTIDSLSFDFVQEQELWNFDMLLQIKSTIAILNEMFVSSLLSGKSVRIGNMFFALHRNKGSMINLIIPSNKRNYVDIFEALLKRNSNETYIAYIVKAIKETVNAGYFLDLFGLIIVGKGKIINSVNSLEEFNKYEK